MDMRSAFPGYYQPTREEFAELWKNCIFVLDANVLLNVYRYPKGARDDLLKVLEQISPRLWIPHQVALEYQENRLSVIADQSKKFEEAQGVLKDAMNKLSGGLSSLQLRKKHSAIEIDEFLERIEKEISQFQADLKSKEVAQPDLFFEDKLRNRLDELISANVGEPSTKEELLDIYKEGADRYERFRPPGYMDAPKAKETDKRLSAYFFGTVEIRREFGDLILWKQMIKHVKANDIKHLVFVTDDDKEDWWWIINAGLPKTIGPRPELLQELKEQTSIAHFYMYSAERLLKNATQYLGLSIEPASIEQAQEVRTREHDSEDRPDLIWDLSLQLVRQAVWHWLLARYLDDSGAHIARMQNVSANGVDAVCFTHTGNIGFQVNVISERQPLESFLRRIPEPPPGAFHRFDLSSFHYILVLDPRNPGLEDAARDILQPMSKNRRTGIIVGVLRYSGDPHSPPYNFIPL
jgi:PIN like domain